MLIYFYYYQFSSPKSKTKRSSENQEVFKIYLFQEESVKHMYQNRLVEYLQVPTSDLRVELYKKAAIESIGKKKRIRNRKGLSVWNEEVYAAINKKTESIYSSYRRHSTS